MYTQNHIEKPIFKWHSEMLIFDRNYQETFEGSKPLSRIWSRGISPFHDWGSGWQFSQNFNIVGWTWNTLKRYLGPKELVLILIFKANTVGVYRSILPRMLNLAHKLTMAYLRVFKNQEVDSGNNKVRINLWGSSRRFS